MKPFLILALCTIASLPLEAKEPPAEKRSVKALQESLQADIVIPYKKVGDRELNLHIFHPEGFKPTDSRPAFAVIHGGGWVGGDARRFYPYAEALTAKGYVGISIEYRLYDQKKGITVFDCVKDGRAAIRYIRGHAKELGIDPGRIAAGGGSAGAHVAAGSALFDGFDHADEDLSVSCRPDALILFFPVIDTSEKGYGKSRIGKDWEKISPVHQVKKGVPPTLIFHGDADKTTPYPGAELFTKRMKEAGNTCELITHHGGGHGYIHEDIRIFDETMAKTGAFLGKHMKGR